MEEARVVSTAEMIERLRRDAGAWSTDQIHKAIAERLRQIANRIEVLGRSGGTKPVRLPLFMMRVLEDGESLADFLDDEMSLFDRNFLDSISQATWEIAIMEDELEARCRPN